MPDARVVVISHQFDPTVDYVVEELNKRSTPVMRFDVADFPETLSVAARFGDGEWRGHVDGRVHGFRLGCVSGIYFRRPTGFVFDPQMSGNERRWAAIQARLGFGGLLATLEPWLNHPSRIGFAEYKPVQLSTAAASGFRTPRTLLTNEPNSARAFVADLGRAICKPFGGSGINDEDGPRQLYATVVEPRDCDAPGIDGTMHLFQEYIPKAYDVRLNVVDGSFFAARIHASTAETHVDWRTDFDELSYEIVDTPECGRTSARRYLDALGLRFGALDFSIDESGQWWFLECNPNGQWAWIEDATGMPIAAAIADALENKRPRNG